MTTFSDGKGGPGPPDPPGTSASPNQKLPQNAPVTDFRKKSTLHSTEQDMTLQSQDVQQTPQKRSRGRPKKIVQSTSQLQGISSTSLIAHLMQDSTIQHSAEQTSTTHINYKNGRGHNNGGISN